MISRLKQLAISSLCLSMLYCGSDNSQGPTSTPDRPPSASECNFDDSFIKTSALDGINKKYGRKGIDYQPASEAAVDDVWEALALPARLMGLNDGTRVLDVVDGGSADSIAAYAYPTGIVVHEDLRRAAYAMSAAWNDYLLSLQVGAPDFNGYESTARAMLVELASAEFGPAHYTPPNLEFTAHLGNHARGRAFEERTSFGAHLFLSAVMTHELAHIYNGDYEGRLCEAQRTSDPLVIAAFSREQELEADKTAARFIAEYTNEFEGEQGIPLLWPEFHLLSLDMLRIIDVFDISHPRARAHPLPRSRIDAIKTVYQSKGLEVTITEPLKRDWL